MLGFCEVQPVFGGGVEEVGLALLTLAKRRMRQEPRRLCYLWEGNDDPKVR